MHVLSVPCVVMASINFYVAAYYLFLYFKRPQTREHLPFALLCLSVGLYDIFCVGLYNSLSVDEGVFWQRLQLDVVSFISIFLIWFAFFFTGQKNNRIVKILIGWFAIILAVSLFINPDFSLSAAKPAVKYINLMNILKITYYEGEVGAIYLIGLLSGVLVYIYFIYLFIQYYKKTKRRVLIPFIISQFAYFFALINDTLVSMRVYPFIYVGEYAFLDRKSVV